MKKSNIAKALALVCLSLPVLVTAEKKDRYFAPNNNGVNDSFTIPIKITDKSLIKSWSLIIEDESGKVIRTIGNKVALPSELSFSKFFKQLVTPKTGVTIPSTVTWNGNMDNGEIAPDGKYYYYLTATDYNDNTTKTSKYPITIDTVAPVIAVVQPTDKIFGEGAKSDFKIKQTGSKEDKWVGTIKNAGGAVVRTFTWDDSAPSDFKWDGTDNEGKAVPDGIYSYEVSSTDRAGNVSDPAFVSNIIYSAEKPVTNIVISGSKYFSPETDSPLSAVRLLVAIPVPEASTGNKLTSWSVDVKDNKGRIRRSYNEAKQTNPPKEIIFDGHDDNDKLLEEGRYVAVVKASYLNGYDTQDLVSPEFVLDRTKPSCQLSTKDKIFGAGSKTSVKISMLDETGNKYAGIPAWMGYILNSEDKIVREFDFGMFLPDSVEWNGFDANGKLVPDGKYKFELKATDLAGNTGISVTKETFTLDTKAAKLLLSISDNAFSPDGNKIKDTVTFTPVLKDADGITEFHFNILDDANQIIWTEESTGTLPTSFVWDGKDKEGIICNDGKYIARLSVTSTNGSVASVQTQAFTLDTVPPYVKAQAKWSAFSLDGESIQSTLPISISDCTEESLWKADVVNAQGKTVRTYTWKGTINTNGESSFEWNGCDENGNKCADGLYSVLISCMDDAGNSFNTRISEITLDSRETKVYVTAEYEGISPNGDKVVDAQKFNIRTSVGEGISAWTFDVKDDSGKSIRSWSDKDSSDLPSLITWDGIDNSGKIGEGTYTGELNISYTKGNSVKAVSGPFICTATPPVLSVRTAPQYFSPDNDGTDDDLFIRLQGKSKTTFKSWSFVINDPNGKPFWTTKGTTSITERIIWDGLSNIQKGPNGMAERVQSAMDYPYVFTVTDSLGMTSVVKGVIPVDVLVIRDGNVLKMAVPSIIFRQDHADFKVSSELKAGEIGLDPEKAANNERVLKRISEILNKFRDYKVKVVGHANRVTDNQAEETENSAKWGPALIPLSAERAEFVKNYLVKKGVSASRLSTEGKGGTELVVDYKDRDNNWKNRRVEFILEK